MIKTHMPVRALTVFFLLLAVSMNASLCILIWTAQGATSTAVKEVSGIAFGTSTTTPTTKPTTMPVAKSTYQQQVIPTATPTTKPTTMLVAKSTYQQQIMPTTAPTTKPTTMLVAKSTYQQQVIPTTTPTTIPTTISTTATTLWSPATTQTTLSPSQTLTNAVPSALISAFPDFGTVPLTVRFDGSASTDPEGETLIYTWDFGDGSSGEGPLVDHTYGQEGSYQISLIVTDQQGLSDVAVKMINVAPETTQPGQIQNLPPQASVFADPTSGFSPLFVSFSASGTNDPEGRPLTYLWDFGDGTNSAEESPSHTYQIPGQYMATLLVTDEGGFSDIRAIDIDVRETTSGSPQGLQGQQHAPETRSSGFDISSLVLLTGLALMIAGLFFGGKKN